MRKSLLWSLLGATGIALVSFGASAQERKDIALVLATKGSPFYEMLACGAKEAAAKLGYNLAISAPDKFQPDLQLPVIEAVGAANPAVAIIIPTSGQALTRPIKALADRGIKILTVDQVLSDPSFVETQIITDNHLGGGLAAKEIDRLLDGKGKIFLFAPVPGSPSDDARIVGFEEEIKKHPGITIVDKQVVNNDPQKTAEYITAALSAHPDLAAVFANNDQAVIGSITGLKQAGAAGKVKLVGYDAATAEVAALKNGTVSALIAQNPKQEGELAIELADKALKDEKLPKTTMSELVTIREGDTAMADKYEYKADCGS